MCCHFHLYNCTKTGTGFIFFCQWEKRHSFFTSKFVRYVRELRIFCKFWSIFIFLQCPRVVKRPTSKHRGWGQWDSLTKSRLRRGWTDSITPTIKFQCLQGDTSLFTVRIIGKGLRRTFGTMTTLMVWSKASAVTKEKFRWQWHHQVNHARGCDTSMKIRHDFFLFKAGRNAVQSALSESQTLRLFWELNWCPRTQTTFGTQNCGKAKAFLTNVKIQVLWLIISRETWRSNISACPMEHTKHQRKITNGQGVLNHQ